MRRIALITALVAPIVLVLISPATAASASAPITFDIQIYGNCLSGWSGGGGVSVTWRDSAGALKAEGISTSGGYAWWEFCPTDPSVVVLPGDRIRAVNRQEVRKYVVPNLTLKLDRVNDLATGIGPANRTIRVCSGWSWYIFGDDCRSVRVRDDGTWTFNPHRDIYGGIPVDVFWKSPKGDRLYLGVRSPQIGVTIGKPGFLGWTDPLGAMEVSLAGSKAGGGTATADAAGRYSGVFTDSSGHAVSVRAGDHISAPSLAGDADWIVPTITAFANKQTETVSGSCLNAGGNNRLRIAVIRAGGHERGAGFYWSDEFGDFQADFTSYWGGGDQDASLNIKSGDRVQITCYLPTEDYARWSFVVP